MVMMVMTMVMMIGRLWRGGGKEAEDDDYDDDHDDGEMMAVI